MDLIDREPNETESKIGKERHTKDVKRTGERMNNKRREERKKKRKRINGNEMESAYKTHAFAELRFFVLHKQFHAAHISLTHCMRDFLCGTCWELFFFSSVLRFIHFRSVVGFFYVAF